MSDFLNVQHCLDCHKIRFTDPDHVWNHWQMPTIFQNKFVEVAQRVVCSNCQNKKNAKVRKEKGW